MTAPAMRYDVMVEHALRGVVRSVLTEVGEHGLIGEQHFYITFRTGDEGVEIPDYLQRRYPAEMTIVLQYQFYGLEVADDHLAVTLTFNNVPERLVIPFVSITVFADPSVNFALQFQGIDSDDEGEEDEDGGTMPATTLATADDDAEVADEDGDSEEADEVKTGEVVSLDSFRKNR